MATNRFGRVASYTMIELLDMAHHAAIEMNVSKFRHICDELADYYGFNPRDLTIEALAARYCTCKKCNEH